MSNLVLSRRAGESIRLELAPRYFLTVTVEEVDYDNGVRLRVTAKGVDHVQTVRMGRTLEIIPGVSITIAAIDFKKTRLSIEAPTSVKINRTELLNRTPG